MTTPIEQAEKDLRHLQDQRETLRGRTKALSVQRQQISHAAYTGNAKAKAQLDKLNAETTTMDLELENIGAAIAEAQSILGNAKVNEAQSADRAKALALRDKLAKFQELGAILDDCFADFKSAALEIKTVLDDIHQLGCDAPTSQLFKVNADLAFKTAVQGTPFWSQDFPALAPSQRKTFASLINAWSVAIAINIERRLGTDTKEKAA